MGDAFRRVTVLAPRSRVDLALPADLPVAELTPMVLELVGEPGPGPGSAPVAWRLTGAAGVALPVGRTLAGLGVLDGELLRLGRAAPAPPPPEFDDVADALADQVARRVRRPDDGILPVAAVVAATAVSLLLAGLTGAPAAVLAGGIALGLAAAVCAIVVAARAARAASGENVPDRRPLRLRASAAALAAVPPAAAAGWLLPLGADVVGVTVLDAALFGALTAAVAQVTVRVVVPALLGLFVVAVSIAVGAALLLLTGTSAAGVGAACGTVAVLAGPFLPRVALRLAGVPGPRSRPAGSAPGSRPAGSAPGSRPAGSAPGSRPAGSAPGGPGAGGDERPGPGVALARGHLAGLVLGTAVVAAGGAVLAATRPGPWGVGLAAVLAIVLALRARSFAEPVPARSLQVAALVAAVGTITVAATGPGERLLLVTVAFGVLLLLAMLPDPRNPRSGRGLTPVTRRTVDLAELILTAATVPLAIGALDLFVLVRG